MKQLISLKKYILTILTVFLTAVVYAQDKTVNVSVNKGGGGNGGFFATPWVWVVGGAVFILLLVALLRGRGKDA